MAFVGAVVGGLRACLAAGGWGVRGGCGQRLLGERAATAVCENSKERLT